MLWLAVLMLLVVSVWQVPQLCCCRQSVWTLRVLHPHGGMRPFHRKSTCLARLSLGPCVMQIWSRNPQNFRQGDPRALPSRQAELVSSDGVFPTKITKRKDDTMSSTSVLQHISYPRTNTKLYNSPESMVRTVSLAVFAPPEIRVWLEPFYVSKQSSS